MELFDARQPEFQRGEQQVPTGWFVGERGEQLGRPMGLVEDRRTAQAAQEAFRLIAGGGAIGGILEIDVKVARKLAAGEPGLARAARPGEREGRAILGGAVENDGEMAADSVQNEFFKFRIQHGIGGLLAREAGRLLR